MGTIENPKRRLRSTYDSSSAVYEYGLTGYATDVLAMAALVAAAPASVTVNGVVCDEIDYQLEDLDGVDNYRGIVTWTRQSGGDLQSAGDEKVTFDFGGETIVRKVAYTDPTAPFSAGQTAYGANAKDVGEQLNVRADGTVDGVEIGSRTGSFSVTVLIATATVTNSWLHDRYNQLWTLNDASFRSLSEGECLLVGMTGQERNNSLWEVTYHFDVRMEETGVEQIAGLTEAGVLDAANTINIEGFQYVWTMTEPDSSNEPQLIGAYVADVYPKSDFSLLGITT